MPILTPEERLGQRIADRYRINAVLSKGGMGILFEGTDEATRQLVAVKMLKPAYSMDPDRVARFLRETRIAATLRHPNIASVLDVGQDENGVPFFVIELLRGRSLQDEVDERGILPFDETLAIVLPIAAALGTAHAEGVIHRDVKPGNIFLCCDDGGTVVPKLLDFGIAKSSKEDFETDTGLVMGTPGYMAPEQAQHGLCGRFTDVWAVGAVLYRCLSGRTPHAGGSVPEILGKLVREPVPPLVAADIKKAVCVTIDRALAREPHRRYASIEAFAQALIAAAGASGAPHTDTAKRSGAAVTQEIPAVGDHAVRSAPKEGPTTEAMGQSSRWLGRAIAAAALAIFLLVVLRSPKSDGRPSGGADGPRRREIASRKTAPQSPSIEAPPATATASARPTVTESPASVVTGHDSPAPVHGRGPTAKTVPAAAATHAQFEREPSTGLPVANEW
jgi:serine/threonine protein kinase